jgi:hypothetical protein
LADRFYIHHVRGRLRLETPDYFKIVVYVIKKINGVFSVLKDDSCKSVTIQYDPTITSWQIILTAVVNQGWFNLKEAKTLDEEVKAIVEKMLNLGLEVAEEIA